MNDNSFFTVHSSHGYLKAWKSSGLVHSVHESNGSYKRTIADGLLYIKYFNVNEYINTYGLLKDDVDILDIGYQLSNGDLEKPCEDWRKEVQELRKEN